jgi:FMN phosphatase YigB (HAD superfamily)
MRPKALIFDVDGTLYDAHKLQRLLLGRFCVAHAFHPFAAFRKLKILQAYRRGHEDLRRENCRIEGRETQLSAAAKRLGAEAGNITPVLGEWFDRRPMDVLGRCLRPGLIPLLDAARSQGVKLAAYSDYPCREKLEAMGLADYFEVALDPSSPGVGFLKPNPAGLLHVLEVIGVAAEDAVYIGDRPEVDAEAARRAGVRSLIVGPISFFEIAKALEKTNPELG